LEETSSVKLKAPGKKYLSKIALSKAVKKSSWRKKVINQSINQSIVDRWQRLPVS
jgi:hypothetical protein